MQDPMDAVISGTVMICLLIGVIICAIVDGALPYYWKILIGVLAGFLIYGTVNLIKEDKHKAKKFLGNREDLR